MVELISYNQHVLVNESDAEESWVTKGIAAVVASLLDSEQSTTTTHGTTWTHPPRRAHGRRGRVGGVRR